MRLLLSVLVLTVTSNIGFAGVDYYSQDSNDVANNQAAFTFTGTDGSATWRPLVGARDSDFGLQFTYSTNITVASASSTGSSFGLSGDPFSAVALSLTSSQAGGSLGDTISTTTSNMIVDSYSASRSTSAVEISGSSILSTMYNGSGDNYFGWSLYDSSTLYAIGWAKYSVTPPPPASSSSTTSITISEWAYNTSSSTIVLGDSTTTTPSPTVPEPTGFAIIGLVGLAAGLKRRNRR